MYRILYTTTYHCTPATTATRATYATYTWVARFILLRHVRKIRLPALSPFPIATQGLSPRDGKRRYDHPILGSTVVQDGDQIPSEDAVPQTGTSHAMADGALIEILRLSIQLQQVITERTSVWHPDRDSNPPPAYVDEDT
ncbi:hypothetical protein EDD18DRAFT_1111042 [Armillaria luteobubalina]|uniref:Uncharacterized protein n=1 Tax=Armillaria luteobubalina TaxID=153913 RepID=A0AA39UF24_9AGAR|nr:hypothetical protein EDD18DRAFT_1111042 [Armillaria luteobubalina]